MLFRRKLRDYLPDCIRDVREYRAILDDGEQPEVAELWQHTYDVYAEEFIHDMSEYGVVRWERMLGIVPQDTLTLEERKYNILVKINEQLPFTIRQLHNLLTTLCGENNFEINLTHLNYSLVVKLGLAKRHMFDEVWKLLKKIVPANLILDVIIMYNTHKVVGKVTHGYLRKYKHEQIRREVNL